MEIVYEQENYTEARINLEFHFAYFFFIHSSAVNLIEVIGTKARGNFFFEI